MIIKITKFVLQFTVNMTIGLILNMAVV